MVKLKWLALASMLVLLSSVQLSGGECYNSKRPEFNKHIFQYVMTEPSVRNVPAKVRLNSTINNSKRLDSREQFIAKIAPIAEEIQSKYKIPASVLIAMACLESNYGRSSLSRSANNYFGIKADSSWSGDYCNSETSDLGVYHYQRFRVYGDLEESCKDYAKFLTTKDRYANAFKYSDDPIKFCKTILRDGYCPTCDYLENIEIIRNRYSLDKYDQELVTN